MKALFKKGLIYDILLPSRDYNKSYIYKKCKIINHKYQDTTDDIVYEVDGLKCKFITEKLLLKAYNNDSIFIHKDTAYL